MRTKKKKASVFCLSAGVNCDQERKKGKPDQRKPIFDPKRDRALCKKNNKKLNTSEKWLCTCHCCTLKSGPAEEKEGRGISHITRERGGLGKTRVCVGLA